MHPLADQPADILFTAQLTALQPRLRAFLLAFTGNRPDADEVLQDTNQVLWRKRETFRPDSSFSAWSFQIAAFEARNFLRKRARTNRTEIPSEEILADIAAEVEAHHSDRAHEERRVELLQCLDKLAPADRELLMRRYFEDRPLAALAAERGVNQNALAQKLFRLRAMVLRCIEKQTRQAENVGLTERNGHATRR